MSELVDASHESEVTYSFKSYMAYTYYVNKNQPDLSSHLTVIHPIPRPNTRIGEGIRYPIRHPDLEIISCAEGRGRETQAPAAFAARSTQHAGIY